MSIQYSDALATFILDAGYTKWATGDILELRSGAPAGPNNAAAGTLLVSITLPASPLAAAAARSKGKSGTWSGTGAAGAGTGTNIGHYRIRKSTDAGNTTDATQHREEGTVTVTGGGGDMTVDNVNVAQNQSVTVNSFAKNL